jgi:hypothetical protein
MSLFSFGGSSGAKPGDRLTRQVIRQVPQHNTTIRGLWQSIKGGLPCRGLDPRVFWWRVRNIPNLLAGCIPILVAKLMDQRHGYGVCHLRKICQDGTVLDYGVASHRLITTAGVNKIVAGLNATDTATFSVFKFHAFGTGAVAPAITDTALGTEFTTQYNPDNTRPTGSQTTGGSSNVYRTVGTFTPDASASPTEMGLMSQAATGGGTLLDRFTFTAIPLNGTGDALQTTVDITFPAGS